MKRQVKTKKSLSFIVLDILIAGLILTASIGTTLYLFKQGFRYLENTHNLNILISKIPQTISLIKTLDLKKKQGKEDLGDGVVLYWRAYLIKTSQPMTYIKETPFASLHEIYLYKISLKLIYKNFVKTYQIYYTTFKPLYGTKSAF